MDWVAVGKEFGLTGLVLLATLVAVWKMGNKIYDNMMSSQKDNMLEQKALYDRVLKDARIREEKLMQHHEIQSEINKEVSGTLKSINNWMCNIDNRISKLENPDCIQK